MTPREIADEIAALTSADAEREARSRHGDIAVDTFLWMTARVGGLPGRVIGDPVPDTFWASPWGEPVDGEGEDLARAFTTEVEARAYAVALLPHIGEPPYMEWLRTTPLDQFVAVGEYYCEEGIEGVPYTPYGWADSRGYNPGSWEESERLWGAA